MNKKNQRKELSLLPIRRYFLASLVLFLLAAFPVNARNGQNNKEHMEGISSVTQQRTLKGKVIDENGEPVIGANVLEKGTANGTITNIDGDFTLNINPGAILQITYIGYLNQEIIISNQTSVTIQIKEDSQALDEVVVVGYATQKKVNLSGSVSSINMDELTESRPITNLSGGLAGLAAGVSVTSSVNKPGDDNATILVRGQGTLNNSAPLIIVDGAESDINTVNPQDVESISVLKDAASASIYGSRAANGVILITTKKGKSGKVKVDYNGYVSFQSVGHLLEPVSDYARYMDLMNEAYTNAGQPAKFSQTVIDEWRNDAGKNPLKYPNTNWTDEVFQEAVATNHVLSMSGGSDNIRFYTSFGYLNNPGIIEKSGFERYSLRSNIEAKIQPWITLGANINGYLSETEIGTEELDNVFVYAQASTPGIVLRAPDGRYGVVNNSEDDPQANNVLHRINSITGKQARRNLKTRFNAELKPFKGFSLTGSYSYELTDRENWKKPVFNDRWNFLTETVGMSGVVQSYMYNYNRKIERYFMDGVARYENRFFNKKLDLSVMVGASQEQRKDRAFSAKKFDLLDPSLGVIGGAIGESTTTGTNTIWTMRSYFGRINLGWDNKYLLEVNLRADGSSRFLKENRWGYFPSASAAWRIDQESFMENTRKWLDALKLRVSYGALGNNNVGNYDAISTYAQTNYVLNNTVQMGVSQTALANAMLTWESTYVTDIGLDFTMFNSRLSGTIDYFYKKTNDILIDLPAPLVHGSSSIPKQNSAVVVNKGLEVAMNWNGQAGEVKYSIGGNFTYVTNKVTKFKGDEKAIDGSTMIMEGYPINTTYILVVDRLVQTEEDLAYVQQLIDNAPVKDGVKQNPFVSYKRPELGDFLYKDMNGDGIFNDDDRVPMGHGDTPRFTYGLSLGTSWKGFDISTLIQGTAGLKVVYKDSHFSPTPAYGNQINKTIADGRWYEGIQGKAKYPRLLNGDGRNNRNSDWWLQDKSFLKIRNIQLGYTLPKKIVQSMKMERIRVYGSLENFFTFTSYKGIDPEVTNTKYPTIRQATLGLNVTF